MKEKKAKIVDTSVLVHDPGCVKYLTQKGVVACIPWTVLEELDHRLLNEHPHFTKHNPSSEELARYICRKLTEHMEPGITVEHVTVWESEHCWARYSP